MTRGAREFVAPLTFAVLSKHEVHTEVWSTGNAPGRRSRRARRRRAISCSSPRRRRTRSASSPSGLADDFLSTYFLAHRGPVLLAPAMESAMWAHPAVRKNMELLAARGVRSVGPDSGPLASGREGVGPHGRAGDHRRRGLALATGARRDLAGLTPPRDGRPDPRADRSDPLRLQPLERTDGLRPGRGGARPGRGRHARVRARPALTPPEGVRRSPSRRPTSSHELLLREFPECDGLAMAAAVADFIPEASAERLHRERGRTAPAARAGSRPARLAPAPQARADGRRLRRGDGGSRGPRPAQDGGSRARTSSSSTTSAGRASASTPRRTRCSS